MNPKQSLGVSSNIFLVGIEADDFDATVRTAVDIDDSSEHPDELSDMGSIQFYGAPESKRDTFEKMTEGDLVLFHQNGEYVGTGWIGTTFEDSDLWASSTVWSNTSTPLIYTIEDFIPVAVPASAVNRIFDYADGYSPPKFMRVASKRVTNRPKAISKALQQYSEKHH